MRIVLVADGRSTITRSWLACLAGEGMDIFLVSTFPCEKPQQVHEMLILPVAFSSLAGGQVSLSGEKKNSRGGLRKAISFLRGSFQHLRYRLGPGTLRFYRKRYLDFINKIQPDLVHALRIPFEGMLASFTPVQYPLLVSTWGNDLTLHACGSRRMASWTRKTLQRANGLMADADRDLKLAVEWGYSATFPTLMVPGNGGLDLAYFKKLDARREQIKTLRNSQEYHIINPRGFRPGSVHQDVFFNSIPAILEKIPNVRFICPAMEGQAAAERRVHELGIEKQVLLLPYLPQPELWDLYRDSDIYLSLSSHDGTPNTFLEAIACGCFPIVGDIPSLRAWVEDGKTGLLVDPTNVEQVVETVVRALQAKELRKAACSSNWKIVNEKADRKKVRKAVIDFYKLFLPSSMIN